MVLAKPQDADVLLRNYMVDMVDKRRFGCLVVVSDDSDFNFCFACFSGKYPVKSKEMKVKRVGDFVDDGLNGSIQSIDGGWLKGLRNQDKVEDVIASNTSKLPL
ncbi:hypothetical protein WN944_029267 [Citrus x changshan-huyou]|uniref:Uncharacterized protein n=1 Tax=Citrus x changshan-huyou TaxID=2935761 RepID=A0AAP0LKV6_9ROSI